MSLFLWTANRSLIERAARRTRGLPLEESRQIATVALFRAFERFDPARGVPFAAYAAYWFRKEAQRGRASAAYRSALPVHRLDALGRGESAADANLREIAGASNLDDAPVLRSTAPTPEEATLESLTSAEVRCEVARLAPLPRRIVVLRFGFDGNEPRSNRAVAALVGVSEFTVRTHLSRALRVLRARLGPTDNVALCPP